jgi:RNA polymerase sigma factor (TIGR02999 family)
MAEWNQDVTGLLQQWQARDADALERLLPLVYHELQRVARASLRREQPGHTLQATALVHEAYLRLTGPDHPNPQNRAHFLAVASRLMRQILVDHARKKQAK